MECAIGRFVLQSDVYPMQKICRSSSVVCRHNHHYQREIRNKDTISRLRAALDIQRALVARCNFWLLRERLMR